MEVILTKEKGIEINTSIDLIRVVTEKLHIKLLLTYHTRRTYIFKNNGFHILNNLSEL